MIGLSYGNFQAVTTAPFSFGNALKFDGTDDFVTRDFTGETAIKNNQPFTVCLWFKFPNAIGSFTPRLFGLSTNAGSGRGEFIGLTTAGGYTDLFSICNDGARKRIAYTFSTDTWYHLAITYNGSGFTTISNYKIYINGVSQSILTAGNFSSPAPNDIILGGHFAGSYQGEKTFDQFIFYDNYEATSGEIAALYNSGNGEYVTTAITGGTPKVIYEFNQSGADTTATDTSGNGFDGTLNNFLRPPEYWVAH